MLYLVRHGQTTANAARVVQDQRDPELTEVGVRQAATLVSVLPAAARVVSSPLRRARVTAAALDRPVEVDDRWIEIDFGELEYRPVAEIRESVWPKWREDPEWVPAGGESLGDVARRVGPACDALAALAVEGDVIVVAHVTPIKLAVAWALGVGPEVAARMTVDLASITTVEVRPDRLPVLRSFNDRAHVARGEG